MEKGVQFQGFVRFWRLIRPWLAIIAVFMGLRFTGLLPELSKLAGSAVMLTGAMDASAGNAVADNKNFDYDFQIKDMDGKTVDVKDFKNKTIFLNIWATWCGPCRMEMPSIQNLYNQVDRKKIVFIILSVDNPGHDTRVTQYLKSEGFTFPVYRPINNYLPTQLRVSSIPTTFIISPEGKIVSKNVGAANYDNDGFKKYLEGLSGKDKPTTNP
jgi:thiol-disulfide isomerase/thioredoxin